MNVDERYLQGHPRPDPTLPPDSRLEAAFWIGVGLLIIFLSSVIPGTPV